MIVSPQHLFLECLISILASRICTFPLTFINNNTSPSHLHSQTPLILNAVNISSLTHLQVQFHIRMCILISAPGLVVRGELSLFQVRCLPQARCLERKGLKLQNVLSSVIQQVTAKKLVQHLTFNSFKAGIQM